MNKKTADEFGINGFPTMLYFNNKEEVKYDGAYKEHALVSWIKTGKSESSLPLNLKELEKLKETEHVFYTFFGDLESKEYKLYNMIAKYDEFRFFTHTNDPAAIEKYNVKAPTVVAFRHFDEPIVHLDGPFERINVMNFVREKGKAKCMNFAEIDKLNIFRAKATAVFLIVDDLRHEHLIDVFCSVAKQDDSPLMYAYVSINNKDQKDLREYINVHEREAPILVMINFEVAYGMMRYEYDGDVKGLNHQKLKDFIKRFKSGALERHYYDDQEKMWYHLKAPTTLTYENYNDIVMDTDNDVVVYYYTTNRQESTGVWYQTELNQLSEEIGRPDHLILTRYDWHKAPPVDHPNAKRDQIVLYPKNDKQKGIVYSGEKSVEKIREFIQDNSSVYRELFPKKEDL